MPTVNELMAASLPVAAAARIGQDNAFTGLTAAGTTQANALVLASKASVFTTVASGSGAILGERGIWMIVNNGANALLVYPPVGSNMNGGTTNAAISLPAGKCGTFTSNNLIYFANISS